MASEEDAEKTYESMSDENSKRHRLPAAADTAADAAMLTPSSDAMDCGVQSGSSKAAFCCPAPSCGAVFKSSGELDSHYVNYHRYQCSQCQQSFIYDRLLEIHIEEAHDSFFAVMSHKKPSYACFAPGCAVLSKDSRARAKHMCNDHHYTEELVAAMMNPPSIKHPSAPIQGNSKKGSDGKACHFFNSKAGCRSGGGCRFRHEARTDRKLDAAAMDVDAAADALLYDFERSMRISGSVKFGRKLKKSLCK